MLRSTTLTLIAPFRSFFDEWRNVRCQHRRVRPSGPIHPASRAAPRSSVSRSNGSVVQTMPLARRWPTVQSRRRSEPTECEQRRVLVSATPLPAGVRTLNPLTDRGVTNFECGSREVDVPDGETNDPDNDCREHVVTVGHGTASRCGRADLAGGRAAVAGSRPVSGGPVAAGSLVLCPPPQSSVRRDSRPVAKGTQPFDPWSQLHQAKIGVHRSQS